MAPKQQRQNPTVALVIPWEALEVPEGSSCNMFMLRLNRKACEIFLARLDLARVLHKEYRTSGCFNLQRELLAGIPIHEAVGRFYYLPLDGTQPDIEAIYYSRPKDEDYALISGEQADLLLQEAETIHLSGSPRWDFLGRYTTPDAVCEAHTDAGPIAVNPISMGWFEEALERIAELERMQT